MNTEINAIQTVYTGVIVAGFAHCSVILCFQYDLDEYRSKKEITVRGSGCPKPITNFHQAQFPRKHTMTVYLCQTHQTTTSRITQYSGSSKQ